jgi:hypothetical protein
MDDFDLSETEQEVATPVETRTPRYAADSLNAAWPAHVTLPKGTPRVVLRLMLNGDSRH